MALEIVSTKYGQVRGVIEEDVLLFKGVPYAAPPVGELRWKEPQDPAPWQGVRDCDTYGPRPVQPSQGGLGFEPWASDFYYMGCTAYSEDCLYLNIATDAQSPEEKRPVYMWFHGGGLSSGYSYEVEFNPAVLAKKGIVVVTVGQRLNVFGYLSLPQLSAEQGGISGNYGLMDEVKALNWVRENIAAFGPVWRHGQNRSPCPVPPGPGQGEAGHQPEQPELDRHLSRHGRGRAGGGPVY